MRPTVSHSWAHRNMMQKSPWMEYSGSTNWRENICRRMSQREEEWSNRLFTLKSDKDTFNVNKQTVRQHH